MRSRIFVLPVLEELKELLRSPFLEQAHERAPDGLHLCARDLGDFAISINETARDLLELEIPSNVGVHEDLGQLARGDDEFGDKIDGIVAVPADVGGRLSAGAELAVELREE